MSASPVKRHYGLWSWVLGFVVLLALGAAVAMMFHHTMRSSEKTPSFQYAAGNEKVAVPVPTLDVGNAMPRSVGGELVHGVVRGPQNQPVPTATVTLFRLVTAWPEWQAERVDEALTDNDGSFEFHVPSLHGLLVGFEHPSFAGGLDEVPLFPGAMTLRLRPQFRLWGRVLNDSGAPVPNARVALESVPGEHRRAQVTYTSADGGYEFAHLAAGPARLVAHHPSWQPSVAPALVIGDRTRFDLRFERPAASPLRGKVVSSSTQQGIAGAKIQLVPINRKLGLVDPISTTTDDDGTFLLEGLARGSMRLFVRHPEFGSVERTQAIRAVAEDLVIEMPLRSKVIGTVGEERFDNVFQGGEVLELTDVAGELSYAVLQEDGKFAFDRPMSPGWASMRVIEDRFAFQRSYIASQSVLIREEEITELDVGVVLPSTVRGRFVDESGKPVAGVRVISTRRFRESAKRIGNAAVQMDLSTVGLQFAQLFGSERDRLLAVSDENGRYEVRGFRSGQLLARAERRGFGSTWIRMKVPSPGKPLEREDTLLQRGCRISGVVLRRRSPLAGATVIVSGDDCQGVAVTDRVGHYEITDLVPGTYSVRARITGQSTGSDEQEVTVAPLRPASGVNIRLQVGRSVSGFVTSTTGLPLANVLVSVKGSRGQVRATQADGTFEIDVPDEAVELQVSLGDRSRQKLIAIAKDQENVSIELDSPPTCRLIGNVFGLPRRMRVLGALLRLTPMSTGAGEARTRWVEMEDGELDFGLCPSGEVRIEIAADGYAPFTMTRTLAPNETHNLGEVLLEPGARLRGVVRDADGAGVADAVVVLGEENDLDLYEPAVRSAADGTFSLQGVTSRSNQMVVRAPGFAASTVEIMLPRDVLSSQPLEVVLERGATIEVVAADPSRSGGLVQLRRNGHLLANEELNDDGKAWFANRSAGSYTVELFGGRGEPLKVVVEPGAEMVRVELPASGQ